MNSALSVFATSGTKIPHSGFEGHPLVGSLSHQPSHWEDPTGGITGGRHRQYEIRPCPLEIPGTPPRLTSLELDSTTRNVMPLGERTGVAVPASECPVEIAWATPPRDLVLFRGPQRWISLPLVGIDFQEALLPHSDGGSSPFPFSMILSVLRSIHSRCSITTPNSLIHQQ